MFLKTICKYICTYQKKVVPLPDFMWIYFLLIRIAAAFGHKKAQLIVKGQRNLKPLLAKNVKPLFNDEQVIWIHAASVGEFEQARPIIEQLADKQQPNLKIVVTFFSPSGYEMRKDYPLADKVLYLPFATRRNAKRFLNLIKPTIAIFVKYEFWKPYLRELNRRNIPTCLICGIFNPKQLFFKPWGISYRRLLKYFTTLFVQDNDSLELLAKFNIKNVVVAGDTRFDRVYHIAQKPKDIPAAAHFVGKNNKVIVAGSTWPQDEEFLAKYINEHENVKLILVPHEIDEAHMHTIFQLFKGRMVRFTEATPLNLLQVQTLVVDTMGLLSSMYRYGHVAYVGGGFGVGIHNTLEPAVFGMPVLFGPNFDKFREAKGLVAAGAAFTFKTYSEFETLMNNALEKHTELGQKATQYIQSELGATDKIIHDLWLTK